MQRALGEGIGSSVPRLEDDRYLRGKGEFIADIRLPGMRDLAFVRSPVAHARIRAVRKPPGAEAMVFVAGDLAAAADRGCVRSAGFQAVGSAGAGRRKGAPCRRSYRRLRGRQPGRRRGPCRVGRRGVRRVACLGRYARGAYQRNETARALGEQRLSGDLRRGCVGAICTAGADCGAAAVADGAAMHVAARRPRCGGNVGPTAGATARV